jgi:integrase
LRYLIQDLRRAHNRWHQFLGTLFVAHRFRHSFAIHLIDRLINRLTLGVAACLIRNIVSCSIY